MASHFRPLIVKDIRRETAECVSVAFDIPEQWRDEFSFTQGQNITIHTILDGEELRRSYSICSSPLDNELRIAIKQIPNGIYSTLANQALKKWDRVDVLAPTGKFFTELSSQQKKNYLAFAAGSGITPILSIIKTTLVKEPQSQFTLVYGNRERQSIIFREELEALKNKYMERFSLHHILSRETVEAPIYQGRIDAEKCRLIVQKILDPKQIDEVFLCGPESMIFSLKEELERLGLSREKIHFELFTVPGQKIATSSKEKSAGPSEKSGPTSAVTIKLDGIGFEFQLAYDGASVLDAALYQGADLPFACKGGVCASCRAKLTEGKVEMDQNYALEAVELEAGFILTCQSHPRSEILKIDFDSK
ncbi:MAG: 1,2-phenylacetyl-CoA epoxidase subunit PaaE [Chitinophagales bacterium]